MNDYKHYRGRGRGGYQHASNFRGHNMYSNDPRRNSPSNFTPMMPVQNFSDMKNNRWQQRPPSNMYNWRSPLLQQPLLLRPPYMQPPYQGQYAQKPPVDDRPRSPLPGSEEARQKAIAEASARIKEQLNLTEIDGSVASREKRPPAFKEEPSVIKEAQKPEDSQVASKSPGKIQRRRSRRSVNSAHDVEELRKKILTQFTYMSKGKIQSLVNNPGSTRYDAALHHLIRDMRLHLSSELRNMYNNRENESGKESNEMIDHFNSIVPDLGVELVSLPDTMVAELSKILQLDGNNLVDDVSAELVEPEDMFKQAEKLLSSTNYLEDPDSRNFGNESSSDANPPTNSSSVNSPVGSSLLGNPPGVNSPGVNSPGVYSPRVSSPAGNTVNPADWGGTSKNLSPYGGNLSRNQPPFYNALPDIKMSQVEGRRDTFLDGRAIGTNWDTPERQNAFINRGSLVGDFQNRPLAVNPSRFGAVCQEVRDEARKDPYAHIRPPEPSGVENRHFSPYSSGDTFRNANPYVNNQFFRDSLPLNTAPSIEEQKRAFMSNPEEQRGRMHAQNPEELNQRPYEAEGPTNWTPICNTNQNLGRHNSSSFTIKSLTSKDQSQTVFATKNSLEAPDRWKGPFDGSPKVSDTQNGVPTTENASKSSVNWERYSSPGTSNVQNVLKPSTDWDENALKTSSDWEENVPKASADCSTFPRVHISENSSNTPTHWQRPFTSSGPNSAEAVENFSKGSMNCERQFNPSPGSVKTSSAPKSTTSWAPQSTSRAPTTWESSFIGSPHAKSPHINSPASTIQESLSFPTSGPSEIQPFSVNSYLPPSSSFHFTQSILGLSNPYIHAGANFGASAQGNVNKPEGVPPPQMVPPPKLIPLESPSVAYLPMFLGGHLLNPGAFQPPLPADKPQDLPTAILHTNFGAGSQMQLETNREGSSSAVETSKEKMSPGAPSLPQPPSGVLISPGPSYKSGQNFSTHSAELQKSSTEEFRENPAASDPNGKKSQFIGGNYNSQNAYKARKSPYEQKDSTSNFRQNDGNRPQDLSKDSQKSSEGSELAVESHKSSYIQKDPQKSFVLSKFPSDDSHPSNFYENNRNRQNKGNRPLEASKDLQKDASEDRKSHYAPKDHHKSSTFSESPSNFHQNLGNRPLENFPKGAEKSKSATPKVSQEAENTSQRQKGRPEKTRLKENPSGISVQEKLQKPTPNRGKIDTNTDQNSPYDPFDENINSSKPRKSLDDRIKEMMATNRNALLKTPQNSKNVEDSKNVLSRRQRRALQRTREKRRVTVIITDDRHPVNSSPALSMSGSSVSTPSAHTPSCSNSEVPKSHLDVRQQKDDRFGGSWKRKEESSDKYVSCVRSKMTDCSSRVVQNPQDVFTRTEKAQLNLQSNFKKIMLTASNINRLEKDDSSANKEIQDLKKINTVASTSKEETVSKQSKEVPFTKRKPEKDSSFSSRGNVEAPPNKQPEKEDIISNSKQLQKQPEAANVDCKKKPEKEGFKESEKLTKASDINSKETQELTSGVNSKETQELTTEISRVTALKKKAEDQKTTKSPQIQKLNITTTSVKKEAEQKDTSVGKEEENKISDRVSNVVESTEEKVRKEISVRETQETKEKFVDSAKTQERMKILQSKEAQNVSGSAKRKTEEKEEVAGNNDSKLALKADLNITTKAEKIDKNTEESSNKDLSSNSKLSNNSSLETAADISAELPGRNILETPLITGNISAETSSVVEKISAETSSIVGGISFEIVGDNSGKVLSTTGDNSGKTLLKIKDSIGKDEQKFSVTHKSEVVSSTTKSKSECSESDKTVMQEENEEKINLDLGSKDSKIVTVKGTDLFLDNKSKDASKFKLNPEKSIINTNESKNEKTTEKKEQEENKITSDDKMDDLNIPENKSEKIESTKTDTTEAIKLEESLEMTSENKNEPEKTDQAENLKIDETQDDKNETVDSHNADENCPTEKMASDSSKTGLKDCQNKNTENSNQEDNLEPNTNSKSRQNKGLKTCNNFHNKDTTEKINENKILETGDGNCSKNEGKSLRALETDAEMSNQAENSTIDKNSQIDSSSNNTTTEKTPSKLKHDDSNDKITIERVAENAKEANTIPKKNLEKGSEEKKVIVDKLPVCKVVISELESSLVDIKKIIGKNLDNNISQDVSSATEEKVKKKEGHEKHILCDSEISTHEKSDNTKISDNNIKSSTDSKSTLNSFDMDSKINLDTKFNMDNKSNEEDESKMEEKCKVDNKLNIDAKSKMAAESKLTAQSKMAADSKITTESNMDVKSKMAAESKLTAQSKMAADSKITTESNMDVKSKMAAESKLTAQSKMAADSKITTESNMDVKSKMAAESKLTAQSKMAADSKITTESNMDVKSKMAAESKLTAQSKMAADSKITTESNMDVKSKMAAESKLTAQSKMAFESKITTESNMDAKSKMAAESKLTAQSKMTAESEITTESNMDVKCKMAAESNTDAKSNREIKSNKNIKHKIGTKSETESESKKSIVANTDSKPEMDKKSNAGNDEATNNTNEKINKKSVTKINSEKPLSENTTAKGKKPKMKSDSKDSNRTDSKISSDKIKKGEKPERCNKTHNSKTVNLTKPKPKTASNESTKVKPNQEVVKMTTKSGNESGKSIAVVKNKTEEEIEKAEKQQTKKTLNKVGASTKNKPSTLQTAKPENSSQENKNSIQKETPLVVKSNKGSEARRKIVEAEQRGSRKSKPGVASTPEPPVVPEKKLKLSPEKSSSKERDPKSKTNITPQPNKNVESSKKNARRKNPLEVADLTPVKDKQKIQPEKSPCPLDKSTSEIHQNREFVLQKLMSIDVQIQKLMQEKWNLYEQLNLLNSYEIPSNFSPSSFSLHENIQIQSKVPSRRSMDKDQLSIYSSESATTTLTTENVRMRQFSTTPELTVTENPSKKSQKRPLSVTPSESSFVSEINSDSDSEILSNSRRRKKRQGTGKFKMKKPEEDKSDAISLDLVEDNDETIKGIKMKVKDILICLSESDTEACKNATDKLKTPDRGKETSKAGNEKDKMEGTIGWEKGASISVQERVENKTTGRRLRAKGSLELEKANSSKEEVENEAANSKQKLEDTKKSLENKETCAREKMEGIKTWNENEESVETFKECNSSKDSPENKEGSCKDTTEDSKEWNKATYSKKRTGVKEEWGYTENKTIGSKEKVESVKGNKESDCSKKNIKNKAMRGKKKPEGKIECESPVNEKPSGKEGAKENTEWYEVPKGKEGRKECDSNKDKGLNNIGENKKAEVNENTNEDKDSPENKDANCEDEMEDSKEWNLSKKLVENVEDNKERNLRKKIMEESKELDTNKENRENKTRSGKKKMEIKKELEYNKECAENEKVGGEVAIGDAKVFNDNKEKMEGAKELESVKVRRENKARSSKKRTKGKNELDKDIAENTELSNKDVVGDLKEFGEKERIEESKEWESSKEGPENKIRNGKKKTEGKKDPEYSKDCAENKELGDKEIIGDPKEFGDNRERIEFTKELESGKDLGENKARSGKKRTKGKKGVEYNKEIAESGTVAKEWNYDEENLGNKAKGSKKREEWDCSNDNIENKELDSKNKAESSEDWNFSNQKIEDTKEWDYATDNAENDTVNNKIEAEVQEELYFSSENAENIETLEGTEKREQFDTSNESETERGKKRPKTPKGFDRTNCDKEILERIEKRGLFDTSNESETERGKKRPKTPKGFEVKDNGQKSSNDSSSDPSKDPSLPNEKAPNKKIKLKLKRLKKPSEVDSSNVIGDNSEEIKNMIEDKDSKWEACKDSDSDSDDIPLIEICSSVDNNNTSSVSPPNKLTDDSDKGKKRKRKSSKFYESDDCESVTKSLDFQNFTPSSSPVYSGLSTASLASVPQCYVRLERINMNQKANSDTSGDFQVPTEEIYEENVEDEIRMDENENACTNNSEPEESEMSAALTEEIIEQPSPSIISASSMECQPVEDCEDSFITEEGIFCMGHQKSILNLQVIGDEFLAASEDGTIYKYCLKTGQLQDAYTGHKRAVTCMYVIHGQVLNIDSTLLYSGSLDRTLKCFNIDTAEIVHSVTVEQAIQCLDSAWGHIFLGTYDGLLFIYNIKKKLLNEQSLTIASATVLMIKATQEGSRQILILASRKKEIMVRDAFTGLLLRTMCEEHRPTIYSLLLDRSQVYCGTSDQGILVLDFNNGSPLGVLTAGKGVVCMVLYRSLLFAGCYDGMIYVYHSHTKQQVARLSGPGDGMLLSLTISNDVIVAGTKKNHLLKIWKIPQEVLSQCE